MDIQTDLEDQEYLGRTTQPAKAAPGALVISNKDLAPMVARAASVVQRNPGVPVLGHLLLRSSPDGLTIDANNLEMAIRQSCPAPGPDCIVCVEATSLNALLRQLPFGADIRLEIADSRHVILKSGSVRAKLATLPVVDYPTFRDLTYAATLEISGVELRLALTRTRSFVSIDASRYYLSGVHFRARGGNIRLEGTDGKCLGLSVIDVSSSGMMSMILPMRAVDEILKIIGTDNVTIRTSAVGVEVTTGNITFLTKLIDATYPDVDRVIPKSNEDLQVWHINRDAMLKVIATASATGSASSIADFQLSESGSQIRVEERSEQLKRDDEITVDLDDTVQTFRGPACDFRIRLSEMTAILKAAGRVCEFRPNKDLSWFHITDVDDPRATFVVGTYR